MMAEWNSVGPATTGTWDRRAKEANLRTSSDIILILNLFSKGRERIDFYQFVFFCVFNPLYALVKTFLYAFGVITKK